MSLPHATLVLGGARSGKSRHAETLILGAAGTGLYVATATAGDEEMAARIRHHQERRDPCWDLVEEPLALVKLLRERARPECPILVDCLTLWLSNLMGAEQDVEAEAAALVAAIPGLGGPVVFVANEVGLGIVPDNPIAREFRDHAGRLNQAIAAVSDRVVFVAAGLALALKGV